MEEEDQAKLQKFFRKEYFEWINFDRSIAEAARALSWEFNLKSKDAVHIASAQKAMSQNNIKIDFIHSYDKQWEKISGKVKDITCPMGIPEPEQRVMILGDSRKPKEPN